MTITEVLEACERLQLILWRHLAMPLEDHDGGDEDDRLVGQRRFLRALRKPNTDWFRMGRRLYAVHRPDPLAPLIRHHDPGHHDPGDEDRSAR